MRAAQREHIPQHREDVHQHRPVHFIEIALHERGQYQVLAIEDVEQLLGRQRDGRGHGGGRGVTVATQNRKSSQAGAEQRELDSGLLQQRHNFGSEAEAQHALEAVRVVLGEQADTAHDGAQEPLILFRDSKVVLQQL